MLRITNVSFYEGEFKNGDQSFQIMVEDDAAYTAYLLGPEGILDTSFFPKSMLSNAKDFPEAVGKFIPELVSLEEPINVENVPTYQEANDLLRAYFERYGVEF
jgi:hypothetical protein